VTTYQPPTTKTGLTIASQSSILLYALWRSGTHWLSEMLSDLTGLPSIYYSNDNGVYSDETIAQVNLHRENTILIRHICTPPEKLLRHTVPLGIPVVLLFRDPRDVIASNVNMRKFREGYRPELPPFPDMSIDEILDWEITKLGRVYGDLLPRWAGVAHDNIFKIRYEELLTDTFSCLLRLAEFLHVDIDEETVRGIARAHQFQHHTDRMPGEEEKSSQRRKGIIGDFRDQFSPGQQERLDTLLRPALKCMGYH
jgi:hypothetical protein